MPSKYRLDNGLDVVLWESHRSPVISAQVWVRNGSIDEQRGQEGLSHFIEHLLFKGTENYGVGQIAQTVEGSGGELNAYTSFDHTVYYVNISSSFAPVALDVLSQMMSAPLFDPVEIENERGVILEEIKRSEDSPARQASRLLFETNYKKHPYRRPVLGYERVVEKIPVRKIIEFFESRYTPSNMTLVVSGDFNPRSMKALVAKKFSGLKKRAPSKRSKFLEPKQERVRIEVRRSKFQEDMVFAAWKIPGAKHKDAPALDVLSLILGQGESSRLYQRLRLEKSLVKSVGCSAFTPQDQGLLAISLSLIPTQSEEAFAEVIAVLSQFIREGATEQEVQKAILQISADEVYSFETAEGLANKIGMGQFYFDNPEHLKSYLKAISEVTAKDIHRVAKRYLTPEGLSISALLNTETPDLKPLLRKFNREYRKVYGQFRPVKSGGTNAVKKLPRLKLSNSDSKLQILQLSNGIHLYHREDDSLPIYSIKMGVRGGSYAEPVQGVSDMMGRLWSAESESYSEAQIHQAMESTSSHLSSFGGRNTNGVTMGGLSTFFEKNLPYFMASLVAPSFPDPLWEREKFQVSQYLKSRADQPQHQASLRFHQLMFGEHPYAKDTFPTQEILGQLKTSDLKNFYEQVFSPERMFVACAGRIPLDLLIRELEKIPRSSLKAPTRVEPPAPLRRDHFSFFEMDKEQTHIFYGFRGTKIADGDRYALSVLQGILSGQGGRLFIELRDKHSLAYTVAPIRMEGVDSGYFGAYIACSPEKGEKSLRMMREEFERLCQEKVTEGELERSKRYLMGRHDLDLQRTGSKSSSILFNVLYGLSPREDQEFLDRVQAVSIEDILELSQKLFDTNFVVSAVGRISPW